MDYNTSEKPVKRFKPALIIHGGAGAISRANLHPALYARYRHSLLTYLASARALLDDGATALDAACHAVSRLEDDPLFNCGRGAVFTEAGTIELEASVMVASLSPAGPPAGSIKRTGAVSGVRNTRHPIQLARQVLLQADADGGAGPASSMHCHVGGKHVEEWGWARGLERKDNGWFWTRPRWEEHRRGLDHGHAPAAAADADALPSQGTVGTVCIDAWGNIAVATSTGGLTNKAPGRVGDTPTAGAGFWAESWDDFEHAPLGLSAGLETWMESAQAAWDALAGCLPALAQPRYVPVSGRTPRSGASSHSRCGRRVVAMSGTGNGDSFLRVGATRTAAAMCRFSPHAVPLQVAVSAMAGPGGELQRSAGDRWMTTGEAQGGIIGLELSDRGTGDGGEAGAVKVVYDFNCGGMWRAWYEVDGETGEEEERVMVFRDEY